MTNAEIKGLTILMKNDKTLLQTKKIRIYQREKLVDKIKFLIPMYYNDMDLSVFTVLMQYIGEDGTVHMETLNRLTNGQGYEDYINDSGDATHMIYQTSVDTKLTKFAGDIKIKLSLQYTDYSGQTISSDLDSEATDPQPVLYVLNTDTTIITVLPIADYYSVIPDESLSEINRKIAELENMANMIGESKADNIELDTEDKSVYLTAHGTQVGDKIYLNDFGDALADNTDDGLVKVIL